MLDPKRMDVQTIDTDIISIEPASGALLWARRARRCRRRSRASRAPLGPTGRRSRLPSASRRLRRFANVVRGKADKFAELIARETGKPLWEAKTEVDTVVNKVDISVHRL